MSKGGHQVLRVSAPAKVNLHLAVGARRADGYHALTGVFHALALHDEIEIRESGSLELTCATELGVLPHQNLAYRAAVAIGHALGREPRVSIVLTKRIPHGAGLGGGSSDAAAVIAGLATMWGIDPRDERCIAVARSLGADVAFFLVPGGAALMTGRGDVVERELPAAEGTPLVLVRPPRSVSTAAAYAAFDRDPMAVSPPDAVIAALESGGAAALGAAVFNNLAAASISVVSEVADALAWVRTSEGVTGAAVSGSGSAVFAVCESAAAARMTAERARERGWWSLATALGGSGVAVMRGEG